MKDQFLDCARCGIEFIWTLEEQRLNPTPPTQCPADRAIDELTSVRRGKVKWYDRVKGFGFITSEQGADLFVHRSGLERSGVRTGQEVTFEVQQGKRGPQAVNVRPVADS